MSDNSSQGKKTTDSSASKYDFSRGLPPPRPQSEETQNEENKDASYESRKTMLKALLAGKLKFEAPPTPPNVSDTYPRVFPETSIAAETGTSVNTHKTLSEGDDSVVMECGDGLAETSQSASGAEVHRKAKKRSSKKNKKSTAGSNDAGAANDAFLANLPERTAPTVASSADDQSTGETFESVVRDTVTSLHKSECFARVLIDKPVMRAQLGKKLEDHSTAILKLKMLIERSEHDSALGEIAAETCLKHATTGTSYWTQCYAPASHDEGDHSRCLYDELQRAREFHTRILKQGLSAKDQKAWDAEAKNLHAAFLTLTEAATIVEKSLRTWRDSLTDIMDKEAVLSADDNSSGDIDRRVDDIEAKTLLALDESGPALRQAWDAYQKAKESNLGIRKDGELATDACTMAFAKSKGWTVATCLQIPPTIQEGVRPTPNEAKGCADYWDNGGGHYTCSGMQVTLEKTALDLLRDAEAFLAAHRTG